MTVWDNIEDKEGKMRDIRKDIFQRMEILDKKREELLTRRDNIDEQLKELDKKKAAINLLLNEE